MSSLHDIFLFREIKRQWCYCCCFLSPLLALLFSFWKHLLILTKDEISTYLFTFLFALPAWLQPEGTPYAAAASLVTSFAARAKSGNAARPFFSMPWKAPDILRRTIGRVEKDTRYKFYEKLLTRSSGLGGYKIPQGGKVIGGLLPSRPRRRTANRAAARQSQPCKDSKNIDCAVSKSDKSASNPP